MAERKNTRSAGKSKTAQDKRKAELLAANARRRHTVSVIMFAMGLFLIALAFILFTYDPPHIPLFRDPVTGAYGIPK